MPRNTHALQAKPRPALIDRIIYVVAVAEPLANLPQILTIYRYKEAAGVSIASWSLYAAFAATWLWYGIHTKQKPMIVGGTLFFVTDAIVIVGALLYGGKI